MSVHIHPTAGRGAPAAILANQPTYGFFDVARRLGHAGRSPVWIARYLRLLIAEKDFPAPFPLLRGGGLKEGVDAICAAARWDRRAVDAWLDGTLPPGAVEAIAARELDAHGAALDAGAAALGLALSGGRR